MNGGEHAWLDRQRFMLETGQWLSRSKTVSQGSPPPALNTQERWAQELNVIREVADDFLAAPTRPSDTWQVPRPVPVRRGLFRRSATVDPEACDPFRVGDCLDHLGADSLGSSSLLRFQGAWLMLRWKGTKTWKFAAASHETNESPAEYTMWLTRNRQIVAIEGGVKQRGRRNYELPPGLTLAPLLLPPTDLGDVTAGLWRKVTDTSNQPGFQFSGAWARIELGVPARRPT